MAPRKVPPRRFDSRGSRRRLCALLGLALLGCVAASCNAHMNITMCLARWYSNVQLCLLHLVGVHGLRGYDPRASGHQRGVTTLFAFEPHVHSKGSSPCASSCCCLPVSYHQPGAVEGRCEHACEHTCERMVACGRDPTLLNRLYHDLQSESESGLKPVRRWRSAKKVMNLSRHRGRRWHSRNWLAICHRLAWMLESSGGRYA